jgi:hypothetical protein
MWGRLINRVNSPVPVDRVTQREDETIPKNGSPGRKEKTLKGKSHERWGMKKDPKVWA